MRKQKRKLSNRESARSPGKEQKHLDDLTAQVGQLRKENGQIITNLKASPSSAWPWRRKLRAEAQMTELGGRLHSLGEDPPVRGQAGGGSSAKTPSS
ncbi:unnamed protein product [Spirodela intermedia]|uniref:BZIP domain-containing protein n=1 Tax=Spirodela intermedia TaxID=51605 RepID=A0ABN7EBN0_SPIIN|nr:unnamed protein product [Spirodela intermedia]